jgi:hypothetical protein
MSLPSWINVSVPTKSQVIKSVELVAVAFVSTSVYSWINSPNPFSKAAVVGAGAAGIAAVYSLIKIFVSNL